MEYKFQNKTERVNRLDVRPRQRRKQNKGEEDENSNKDKFYGKSIEVIGIGFNNYIELKKSYEEHFNISNI